MNDPDKTDDQKVDDGAAAPPEDDEQPKDGDKPAAEEPKPADE